MPSKRTTYVDLEISTDYHQLEALRKAVEKLEQKKLQRQGRAKTKR